MRRHLILSLCLTAFMLLAGTASMQAQGGGSCSASSLFGLFTCSVTCSTGTAPICTAGLFSASCACIPISPVIYPLVPVPAEQIKIAESFAEYLYGLDSDEASRLGEAVKRVIKYSQSGNDKAYSETEAYLVDLLQKMSDKLREQVMRWFKANGYAFPY